jgi:CBS domain-containing protein
MGGPPHTPFLPRGEEPRMSAEEIRNAMEDESLDAPLEGDEGEVVIERHRDLGRAILETRISDLRFPPAVTLPVGATVAKALEVMRKKKIGAVIVVEKSRKRRVAGIFTERDLVGRVLERRAWARLTLDKVMTPAPETLRPKDSLAYALNKMSVGRFRHVPLVDDAGKPVGMLSIRDVIDFVVEVIPEAVLNLPPEPEPEAEKTVDAG